MIPLQSLPGLEPGMESRPFKRTNVGRVRDPVRVKVSANHTVAVAKQNAHIANN